LGYGQDRQAGSPFFLFFLALAEITGQRSGGIPSLFPVFLVLNAALGRFSFHIATFLS